MVDTAPPPALVSAFFLRRNLSAPPALCAADASSSFVIILNCSSQYSARMKHHYAHRWQAYRYGRSEAFMVERHPDFFALWVNTAAIPSVVPSLSPWAEGK